jgi:hypothetical protein
MKMSDFFKLPLHVSGFYAESDPYRPFLSPVDFVDSIECKTGQEARAVSIAINTHDDLVNQLQKQRDGLVFVIERLTKAGQDEAVAVTHMHTMIAEIDAQLKKARGE